MITLEHYLVLSSILFTMSMLGIVMNRRNLIALFACIELMLLAVNTLLVAASSFNHQIDGQIMVFFVLTVAAAETAIGLGIVVLLYRKKQSVDITRLSRLNQ